MIREDFDIHLSKKAGLLIGAQENHLKSCRTNQPEKEKMPWPFFKRIPDGRMAFTAYGKSDDGVLNALKEISDRSIEILQNYGWTVYPTPVNIVFKRSVLNRNASAIVMPGDPKYLSAPSVVQLFAVPTSDGATVWSAGKSFRDSNGEIGLWDMWVTKEAEARQHTTFITETKNTINILFSFLVFCICLEYNKIENFLFFSIDGTKIDYKNAVIHSGRD